MPNVFETTTEVVELVGMTNDWYLPHEDRPEYDEDQEGIRHGQAGEREEQRR